MQLAVVQTRPVFGEVRSNVADALALMETRNADLYVLPELFNTGYNFVDAAEAQRLAEPVEGTTLQAVAKFCSARNCYVVYGFAERSGRVYNSSVLVGRDGVVGVYRKVHLFNLEKIFFAPGDLGFRVFDLPFGRVGMMICFDWYYPESARTLALRGAQLIAHPSNLVLPHCPDAMVTRCLENRVFAATANRVGTEDRGGVSFTYIGKSEIVTPKGEILERLATTEPGIAVHDVSLTLADNKKLNEFNNLLADRQVSSYEHGSSNRLGFA
jgi:predicted amidohydrolase